MALENKIVLYKLQRISLGINLLIRLIFFPLVCEARISSVEPTE